MKKIVKEDLYKIISKFELDSIDLTSHLPFEPDSCESIFYFETKNYFDLIKKLNIDIDEFFDNDHVSLYYFYKELIEPIFDVIINSDVEYKVKKWLISYIICIVREHIDALKIDYKI
ncbi:MAG: hypothetical protein WC346_08635 [Methanogenium sp.]|jgi:hypothetical protein